MILASHKILWIWQGEYTPFVAESPHTCDIVATISLLSNIANAKAILLPFDTHSLAAELILTKIGRKITYRLKKEIGYFTSQNADKVDGKI